MKKIFVPTIIVCLALLVLGVFLFAPKANDYKPSPTSNIKNPKPVANSQATTNSSNPGVYITYSTDVIANTAGTKILFFHAPWCPQCKALDTSIKKGPIPAGTTIIKVDYDSSQALKQKYGVTTQTTLVLVDDNGNLVKKYVAYSTPSLDALIANLL